MEKKTFGITGALLVLGALFRTGTAPAVATPTPTVSSAAANATPSSACSASQSDSMEGPEFAGLREGLSADYSDYLIATVPDPVHTNLALDFDRSIESIIWAAEESKFSLRRSWLPWKTNAEKDLPSLADRKCLKIEAESRNRYPGLLTFSGPGGTRLAVFLVGESPVSGVHHNQFIHALDLLLAKSHCPEVRVLGPSFSGTFATLISEMDLRPDVVFQFASGMATSDAQVKLFQEYLGKRGGTYAPTVETDKRAMELLFKYVAKVWSHQLRVAMLTEEGTVYGTDFEVMPDAMPDSQHHWLRLSYPREISRLRNAYQEERSLIVSAGGTVAAPQPAIHLSLKDERTGGETGDSDGVPAYSRLQSPASQEAVMESIANTVRRERADFVGIVATDVLDSLFLSRYLRKHAPDTRLFTPDADLLFSTRSDGESAEGLLSITTYPLFSRNQHWTAASGTADSKPDRRIPFASRYSQGIYNACRYLLGSGNRLVEYTRPGKATPQPPLWLTVMGRDGYWPVALLDEDERASPTMAKSVQAGDLEEIHPESPGKGWYLVFWLTTTFCYLHTFYLLRILTLAPAQRETAAKPPSNDEEPTILDEVVGFVSQKLFPAYPDPGDFLSEDSRVFLAAATLAAAATLYCLSFPLVAFLNTFRFLNWTPWYFGVGMLIFPLRGFLDWTPWYFGAGMFAVLLQLITAVKLCWTRPIWRKTGSWKPPFTAIMAASAWCLTILVVSVWSSMVWTGYYRSGVFLAYRCFSLSSGVAPNVPVLLLAVAFFWWAITHTRRTAYVESKKELEQLFEKLELDGEEETLKFDGKIQMGAVDKFLASLVDRAIWMPALPFLLVWFLVFVPWRTLRTFEFARYDWMMMLLVAVVCWAIATAWMQFLWCWNKFRAFLQWLEIQPIAPAFSRLRKEISWVPLVSRPPEHLLFISSRAWGCLQCIQSFTPSGASTECDWNALKPDISGDLNGITKLMTTITESTTGSIDPHLYRELQVHMQRAARTISANLKKIARRRDCPAVHKKGTDDPQTEATTEEERILDLQEEFLAYRYLIFIRYVFRNLRNLLGFMIAGFVLSVLALSSYPFQGHRWIGVASTIAFIALGTGVAMVLAGMDRDAVLSRITATDPNRIGPTFYLRLAQFGGLPLLTILAAQFPEVNQVLFSWVRPALEALK